MRGGGGGDDLWHSGRAVKRNLVRKLEMPRKSVNPKDKIAGKVRRMAGELTARPDLVLEGEAQDTSRFSEDAQRDGSKKELPPSRPESTGTENQDVEHEDERVNPGRGGKSAAGASGNRPSGPSNSA